jgi:hypothetical protein
MQELVIVVQEHQVGDGKIFILKHFLVKVFPILWCLI